MTNITLPQCVRDAQEVIHKFRLKQQCRHAKIKNQQFSSMQNVQDAPRKKGNSRIYGAANVAGLTENNLDVLQEVLEEFRSAP